LKTRVVHLALVAVMVSMAACSDRTPPGIVAIELVPNDNVKAPLAEKLRIPARYAGLVWVR